LGQAQPSHIQKANGKPISTTILKFVNKTHRKNLKQNPPEIFSGKPTGNFLRKPTGNLLRETPPEILSETYPEPNQIWWNHSEPTGNLVRPNQIWWNHGEPTGNLVRQTRPEPKQILWWNHREVTGNTAC
jgi:hypothetical protein